MLWPFMARFMYVYPWLGNYLLELLLSSGSLRFMTVTFTATQGLMGLLKPKAALHRFVHSVNLLRLYETEMKTRCYLFGDVNGTKGRK